MFIISCPQVASYQLVTSWLITFKKEFATSVLKSGVICICIGLLDKTELEILTECGASFIIREIDSICKTMEIKSNNSLIPAHVIS